MSSSKQRAVVFDFDGVIADSWKLHEATWRKVLAAHKVSPDREAVSKALGWTSLETAKVLIKETGLKISPGQLTQEKSDLFDARADKELSPMSGAADAIKRLIGDFRLAVTAGRKRALVERTLIRFGVSKYIEVMVVTDDLKPTDELDDLFKLVTKRLDVKPQQSVVVDDSRNGLLAAKRAKMHPIAFDSNPKFKLDHSIADAVVSSLDELLPELIDSVTTSK